MKVFKTATLKVRNSKYIKWMMENAEDLLKQGKTMNEIKDLAKEATGSSGEFESFPALRGETSYDIAVANGYKGTQEEWLNMAMDEEGWMTKYDNLAKEKANAADVYTKKQVDNLLSGVMYDNDRTDSYQAFVAAVNEDTVSAAFGKNNEDMIKGVGRQLAMYAWFKGEDKDDYPFTNLKSMSTLKDMNHDIYKDIIGSDSITQLVIGNEYARDKILDTFASDISDNGASKTITITVSDADLDLDLSIPFRLVYDVHIYAKGKLRITINGEDYRDSIISSDDGILSLDDDVKGEFMSDPLKWKDFGILHAGEYDVTITAGESDDYYTSTGTIIIYKSKQEYPAEMTIGGEL